MARKILWGSLSLAPVTLLAHYGFGLDGSVLFVLAAAALVPLAWLIGEATEHVAEHTGPGIGGFFNASFGNAPELIIALFAVAGGLPDVVRGSIVGSVVSNMLLVLGFSMAAAGGGRGLLDRRSLFLQLGVIAFAVAAFLAPAVPGWSGDPERHALYLVTLPVAGVLLAIYLAITWYNLRLHHAAHDHVAGEGAWSMKVALGALGAATVLTALVAEALVGSLEDFGHAAGLSEFFIAAVIVAIVGNAAEHGGAIVVARRGKIRLASEIAISSSAQVAVFVAPAVALLSWLVGPGLPLSFRPIELGALGVATVVVALAVLDGHSRRWEGWTIVGIYGLVAAGFFLAGDR